MRHTMHLRPGVAKQPNLELKTQPKQLLGSLPLVIALPAHWLLFGAHCDFLEKLSSPKKRQHFGLPFA
jgi:hypothetical protein